MKILYPVIIVGILLLEEQGKLDLDDRIQKFLPDFPVYESPLTLRHFTDHTSGVGDHFELMNLEGRNYLDHIDDDEISGTAVFCNYTSKPV